jgi:hypothetical protein
MKSRTGPVTKLPDLDSELDLWFSGLGKVRLEFKGQVDIRHLGQMIAHYVV